MTIKQNASAEWNGNLKEGSGTFALPKGSYEAAYTHASRFQNSAGTNPEELVGAAFASCFAMFLSATISKNNFTVNTINAVAEVSLEVGDGGPTITNITLNVTAAVEEITKEKFDDYVATSKANCPISKLFKGTELTVNAELV
ncbi:peroxiredoxin [Candidatus Marinamargulisbacteria bacterium SCGC AG-414-C22]|nr:peroxiredoxin [Candidatus Marinamargulisbacteria bacterium SCGC AG-414-C22]